MSRLELLLERPLALLLLPLSILPFLLLVPQMVESRELYERRHESGPLPAPAVVLTAAQVHRFQPVAPYRGAVPVLAYGRVADDASDARAVSRRTFAEQMAALKRMGFQTISTEQFARFRAGDGTGLPARPILITFDGGRLDSYRAADRVLAQHGLRATMFVSTAPIEAEDPSHLTWAELHRMADSGRWDVEPQTHDGARRVAYDELGSTAPFYAVRRYTRSGGLETFADYERRVTGDLFAVAERMRDQGFEPHALALPGGEYGQGRTNDPAIAPFMRALLARQFGVYFARHQRNEPEYARALGEPQRLELHAGTTTDRLYMWLRDHSPGAAKPRGGAPEAEPRGSSARRRGSSAKRRGPSAKPRGSDRRARD
ncbi:MAG TPA: polysaccharide deacetylase family protein [Thermoleophilaceae bacterium]